MNNHRPKILVEGLVTQQQCVHFFSLLEDTADPVIIGRATLDRFTIRGVPGKKCDVTRTRKETSEFWIQVAIKLGRYDDNPRERFSFRIPVVDYPIKPIDFKCISTDSEITLEIGTMRYRYDRLRSSLNDYNPARCVMWHWTRYFHQCISHEDITQIADSFEAMFPDCRSKSLAELNRSVSNHLYKESTNRGWRKMTLREKQALRITTEGYWFHENWIMLHVAKNLECSPTGCGEYTLSSANPS